MYKSVGRETLGDNVDPVDASRCVHKLCLAFYMEHPYSLSLITQITLSPNHSQRIKDVAVCVLLLNRQLVTSLAETLPSSR